MRCVECEIELDENVSQCPQCGAYYGAVDRFFEKMAKIEETFLASFLGVMILLVLIQIFLRNAYSSGIAGANSIIRHLLLWVGFVGAGLATRHGAHIKIDVASRTLPKKARIPVAFITDVFAVAVCFLLVYVSCQFISIEYEGHGEIPYLDIPVWTMQVIIPFGYMVIGLRFGHRALRKISRIVKGT